MSAAFTLRFFVLKGRFCHGTFVLTRQGKVAWQNRGDAPFTENPTLLREAAQHESRLPPKSIP